MATYSLSKSFSWNGRLSEKATQVCRMFGVGLERLRRGRSNHNCCLEIKAGDIVYITGPSGAGKSVLLRELSRLIGDSERIDLSEIKLPAEKLVIDCIEGDFLSSLKMLGTAGLNDVFCVLGTPAALSEGQKYRLRLAMALASGRKIIFADEFCSTLDRITAAVISYNIQRFAKRDGVTFILASSHDDIVADLSPDVLVVKELSGPAEVVYRRL